MLAALLGSWFTSGQPRYISEEDTQTIAYVSPSHHINTELTSTQIHIRHWRATPQARLHHLHLHSNDNIHTQPHILLLPHESR
jgi:hypothetical protein